MVYVKPGMRLLGGVALAVALSLQQKTALAQETAGSAQTTNAEPASDSTIVVTGTRITSNGFSAPTPTTTVSADELQKSAQPNIFSAITKLPSLLGSTGNFNVGTMRALGWDFSGRLRANRNFYLDYDYALTSTALLGANTQLIQSNVTLIPSAQIARVPLHTANLSPDVTFNNGLDLRYGIYFVSAGNTKSLPAYNYSNFSAAYPVKNGVITANLLNVWNQWASIAGLIGNGVPLPLNQYATPSKYTPYIGTAATEQFGLPLRSYSTANARFGIDGGKWNAMFFIDNLTNKVAELSTNNTQFQVNIPQLVRVSTNQPRTLGMEINYHF